MKSFTAMSLGGSLLALVGCGGKVAESLDAPSSSSDSSGKDAVATANAEVGDVVQIATGARHSCALFAHGAVACWGDNHYGQIGIPAAGSSSRPLRIAGLPAATQIAAGGDFTCATLRDASLWCWGANDQAQLGRGFADATPHPIPEPSLAPGGARMALGSSHACTADSPTHCWGAAALGATGDESGDARTLVPSSIGGVSAAIAIASGNAHTCAVASGGVYCWGDSTFGQLGIGLDGMSTPLPFGIALNGLGDIVGVAAGGEHACAYDARGTMMCWGRSDFGQLGYQSPLGGDGKTLAHANRALLAFSNGTPLASVVAGGSTTCGLKTDGVVFCFGANDRGQLGIGAIDTERHPYAAPVEALPPATSIAIGRAHACAIVRDASGPAVQCWGANESGQLGDGTTITSGSPRRVAS